MGDNNDDSDEEDAITIVKNFLQLLRFHHFNYTLRSFKFMIFHFIITLSHDELKQWIEFVRNKNHLNINQLELFCCELNTILDKWKSDTSISILRVKNEHFKHMPNLYFTHRSMTKLIFWSYDLWCYECNREKMIENNQGELSWCSCVFDCSERQPNG